MLRMEKDRVTYNVIWYIIASLGFAIGAGGIFFAWFVSVDPEISQLYFGSFIAILDALFTIWWVRKYLRSRSKTA